MVIWSVGLKLGRLSMGLPRRVIHLIAKQLLKKKLINWLKYVLGYLAKIGPNDYKLQTKLTNLSGNYIVVLFCQF